MESFHPVLFLDALVNPVKDDSRKQKKAFPLALEIRIDRQKKLVGLWVEQNVRARFWSVVLNELRNRGFQDVLIAAVDRLTSFPEAINAAFLKTEV